MKPKDFIGEYAEHYHYGKVFVESAPARSKEMVNIIVKQRSKGWNEIHQKYEPYFLGAVLQKDGSRSLRWKIHHRDEFGIKDTVHINELEIKF